MIKSFVRKNKFIFVLIVMLAVVVSFIPISAGSVYAAQRNTAKAPTASQENTSKPLAQVTGVSAENTETGISLEWKKVSKATEYQIYRPAGNEGEYAQIGTSRTNSFSDSDVTSGKAYSYKIRASKSNNNSRVTGPFSQSRFSRASVVSSALAWLGCRESNDSHKTIIDVYNSTMSTNLADDTSWSAIFVSAVAVKSKTTPIIVRGSHCPTIYDVYKTGESAKPSFGAGSRYVPKAGDIVFFDWDQNGMPNHMGIVASVSGKTVKTIEGNLGNAVGYRTFPIGYSYVLGYGLPSYDEAKGIVFTGEADKSIGCGELAALGIGTEPEGYEDLGKEYDFVEQKVEDNMGDGNEVSDYDRMVYMIKKVKTSAETGNINCSKSQYYAAFIYKLCQEAGIDASIVTASDEEGNTQAWIEVNLDGKWYQINASEAENQMEDFMPEATTIEK